MKIWQWSYLDNDSGSGVVQIWAGSKREVRAMMREAAANEPADFSPCGEPLRIDVPTDKAGLVRFLNAHAGTF
jgi:hypothetical protein